MGKVEPIIVEARVRSDNPRLCENFEFLHQAMKKHGVASSRR
jgi:hypothetical protein